MNNEEGLYLYKNRLSRAEIAFDEEGELLYCQESALTYRYSWSPDDEEEVCASSEEPLVREQADEWLRRSLSSSMQKSYGDAIRRFLQTLWGPLTDYRFESLKPDSPVRTLSANPSLYLYWDKPPLRLAFEFLSPGANESNKRGELRRRRELVSANGWTVIPLTREALERHLPILREQLRLKLK
ncbi:hypothetical protein [Cohnella sp. AR92]|uniref:hypothetical protein n=1 Tax=Cohnella sp. AR92 TaxID=648716 RepID=UPI000F8E332D|nr:hypothetical protein [Cohnella sp. AR92]RUS42850.1 hypothetical protein ELR57_25940 [Cohnella sp. AR92]